jgi:hypothetical protein
MPALVVYREMLAAYVHMCICAFVGKARGPFLTSPLGATFDARGEFCHLGVKLSPGGETLCSPLHMSKQFRVFTPGGE